MISVTVLHLRGCVVLYLAGFDCLNQLAVLARMLSPNVAISASPSGGFEPWVFYDRVPDFVDLD